MRRAAKKPNTPPEELSGLEKKAGESVRSPGGGAGNAGKAGCGEAANVGAAAGDGWEAGVD